MNTKSVITEGEILNVRSQLQSLNISEELINFMINSSIKQLQLINLSEETLEEKARSRFQFNHLTNGWVKNYVEARVQGFIEGVEWTQTI